MARRRFQRGSIVLRGKREKVWVARWREDVIGSDGKVHRVRRNEVLGTKKSFPTERLALRELEARLAPVNSPTYRAQRESTFRDFAEFWKKNILNQKKPSTQYSIGSQLKNHLLPYFGSLMLKDIQWQRIQEFVSQLECAPKTCKNLILTLRMIWKSAKAGGYVSHNPFEGLSLPVVPPSKPFFYTATEAQKIIAAAEGQYRVLYRIAAETGMRPGELCALDLASLNLDALTIHVSRSAWRSIISTPKTPNAIRTIAITEELAEHIRQYLLNWRPNKGNLLFISPQGGPLHPCSVRRDSLGPICDKLSIQAKGLKAFRHGSATLMDQAGVPMKIRQERLGHAPGTKVTMVHYTHSLSQDARSAASTLGSLLTH